MAGTWTSERFPQFEPAIRRLTEQHRELEDEPLHLAIVYEPGTHRDQQDIYLFEVIGGPGGSGVNPDREIFETTFSAAPGLSADPRTKLHLLLTNPAEFRTAVSQGWDAAKEITQVLGNGDYVVLYSDDVGESLLREIRGAVAQQGAPTHG